MQTGQEEYIKQLEKLLENKTTQLNEVTRELEDLSFAVSHDLKAPIRAIAGFSAILKEDLGENLNSEAIRRLNIIEKNAARLTDMLNEIVTYSTLSKKNVLLKVVNMHLLIKDALNTHLSNKEKAVFDITIGDISECNADENMMKQLWINLVNIALLYAEKNEYFKINIESLTQGQQMVFAIQASKILNEHKTGDELQALAEAIASRESLEGSGTGIAFIKRVIYKHSGNFWIQATPNYACTFSFSLPI